MKNSIGRDIPEEILNTYHKKAYGEIIESKSVLLQKKAYNNNHYANKVKENLQQAILDSGLKDGMTISFHHHFRSGDYIVNMVMEEISKLGIKHLNICASSLSTVHEPLIEHIKNHVVDSIETSGLRGKLADEISHGLMDKPVIIHSHGGRARAIETGETHINVAFIGVPNTDNYGNANGFEGESACGSLGYALMDAKYADYVILISDHLVDYPNVPRSIDQSLVDSVVIVDKVGDASKIASGATRYTKDPKELLIAQAASNVITSSPYYHDGFSLQAGSGGASLAVARFLKEKMIEDKIQASFGLGGITGVFADLLKENLIQTLFDVQDFDLEAAKSLKENKRHVEIDASQYASVSNRGAIVNNLDVVILSALEVDTKFNVNVMTGFDGCLRGASGGHSDAAKGAKLTIIVTPLVRGRIPTVVDDVTTVITPGEDVDVLVTERGIAINPRRQDLIDILSKNKALKIVDIETLKEKAYALTGVPQKVKTTDKVVAVIEYRDGSIIDVVKQIEE